MNRGRLVGLAPLGPPYFLAWREEAGDAYLDYCSLAMLAALLMFEDRDLA